MSILIKGMDMPTSCGKCYVGFCKQIGCELSIGFDDYKINRHPNCPLVPVPTPHGRLKDVDAMEYMDFETCDTDDWYSIVERTRGRNYIRKIVKDAPTIIEAEGEDNGN